MYKLQCHHRYLEGETSCPKEDCMQHCDRQWETKTLAQIMQIHSVHEAIESTHKMRLYQDGLWIDIPRL